MTDATEGPARAGRRHPGQIAVAAGVLALAGFVAWGAGEIPAGSTASARIGPRLVPYIAAAGLAVLGGLLLLEAVLGRWTVDENGSPIDGADGPVEWTGVAWFVAGLALNVACLGYEGPPLGQAGFVVASTAVFFCVARAFGSRNWPRDLGLGLGIALVAYLAFDRLLGVTLGAGWLSGVL